ncbi:MAG: hypothetical protein AVDCRST_MAG28-1190 [uncultured Rubrobacteraceae bacterium]|uniref:Uncharacterized protein n=1 Tax=uncultured Rubrobacteraceae bacterium TaxID=349277 RepID=A0A6J4QVP8_9ACTN|nr:MAG: hypothetical protein AVDCRST_MAG28-1190 [uncultured Rubrobacteraceae bacterium]
MAGASPKVSKSQEEVLPECLLSFWGCDLYWLSGCGGVRENRSKIGMLVEGTFVFPNAWFTCARLEEPISALS